MHVPLHLDLDLDLKQPRLARTNTRCSTLSAHVPSSLYFASACSCMRMCANTFLWMMRSAHVSSAYQRHTHICPGAGCPTTTGADKRQTNPTVSCLFGKPGGIPTGCHKHDPVSLSLDFQSSVKLALVRSQLEVWGAFSPSHRT